MATERRQVDRGVGRSDVQIENSCEGAEGTPQSLRGFFQDKLLRGMNQLADLLAYALDIATWIEMWILTAMSRNASPFLDSRRAIARAAPAIRLDFRPQRNLPRDIP